MEERNYSEQTAQAIDAEVTELVEEAHQRAQEILTHRRPTLEALATRLEEKEVISGEEVDEVISQVEGKAADNP
jgi:cell division protease FtsH